MKRFLILIAVAFIAASTAGCAAIQKKVDANTERLSMIEYKMTEDSEKYQERLDALDSRVKILDEAVPGMQSVSAEVGRLTDANSILTSRIQEIEAKLEEYNAMKMEPQVVSAAPVVPSGALSNAKIKVLTGNGSLKVAKQLAGKLKELGYTVKRVDKAPRSNFTASKVYFTPEFQAVAEKLAVDIGQGAITTPMTWKSRFDIIVVAVNGGA